MDFSSARATMVECQLRPNRVTDDALLVAMGSLPRERFLPEALRSVAYADINLPVASGRCIMEPQVLGRLVQAATPRPSDVALVVGGAMGYAAAVLSRLVETVFMLESDAALAGAATALLAELALDNVVVVEGALADGLDDQGPFDVILVNGGVAELPERLLRQLAEGGRFVAVLGGAEGVGRATLLRRGTAGVSRRILFDASVPALDDFGKKAGFVF
jgi:protein-L-isoaspartate(D-aspartate) O-methyltransferase